MDRYESDHSGREAGPAVEETSAMLDRTVSVLCRCLAAIVSVAVVTAGQAAAQQKAFPQAEGFGAAAVGGRGGDVYHVTSLGDTSTPGTLRHGIDTAPSSGRTILFDVGGWINLTSKLGIVKEKHNITIAGQTAPGGGIGVRGNQFSVGGSDIIIRHMRFRPGKSVGRVDSLSVSSGHDLIFDHVSAGFSYDENASANGLERHGISDFTVQYSSVAYGLESHSAGSLIQNADNLSYHHNLYAHNHTRNPKARVEGNGLDWINNVVYDYDNGFIAGDSDTTSYFWTVNVDGNYFITGPGDTGRPMVSNGRSWNYGLYFGTNAYDNDGDTTHDGVVYTGNGVDGTGLEGAVSGTYTWVDTPYATPGVWQDASPQAAYERVLSEFGATPWQRDEVDQRLHDDVVNRTGSLISRESDLAGIGDGGFGVLAAGVAPTDTDRDGMPDAWEMKHGTRVDVANNNGDFDSDGYTDLEEYLNDLGAFKATGPLELDGTGRYADWGNWTGDWEPSRLDEVEINTGTAVVDVVGQKAGTLRVAVGAADSATLQVSSGWIEITDELIVGASGAGAGIVQQDDGEVRVLGDGVTIENGVYNLAGGLLTTPRLSKGSGGALSLTGGVLSADVVEFNLVVDGGTVSPGTSPGSTHFTSDVTFDSGTLLMELAGTGVGEYDTVAVDNALHAGGTLRVELTDSFIPQLGDAFDLLDFAAVDGVFALQLPTLDDGLRWDASRLYSAGVLAVRTVPEPASLVLLVLGAAAFAVARRR
jgi:hypothetical protein